MLWKHCNHYTSTFEKLSSGHRTGKSQFSFQSKERQYQRMFKLLHNCPHLTCYQSNAQNSSSQASAICEPWISDVQAGFRKGRGTRDQIANICRIIKKAREFQKNIYFCFIDYTKAFVWITTTCGKFFKRWEYQITLPAFWEICMQDKKQQLESDMEQQTGSKLGKGVHQGCILSPCLFNCYAEYIMRNAWLDEAQAGIKIAGRNINNLKYADDTTPMAESKEEVQSLLMKVKEESGNSWLKTQHSEN